MDYKLGLNIGITSVGWGIIDFDYNIVNSGVRLFSEADPDNNITKREMRSSRRIIRRKQHRLERLKNLLFYSGILKDKNFNFRIKEIPTEQIYYFRRKGLSELLTNDELMLALYQLIKKRGANDYDLTNISDDNDGTKSILLKNEEKLGESHYVCEIQIKELEDNGRIRGKENIFKTKDLKKEALKILQTQKELGNEKINDEFIEKYINILERKRTYFEGPGKGSSYGWGNQKEWIQGLMGKCTYFPEEIRMIKNSYTAELFNLLNDLNNLKIERKNGEDKLSYEEKQGLINNLFKKQKTISLKKIAKYLGIDEDSISGYRIDGSEKAIFTPLETYITINKVFKTEDRELMDSISEICTYYQEDSDRKEYLKELLQSYNVEDEVLNELAKNKFTGTHSLSKKLLNMLIPEMMETNKNSIQVITELGLIPYKMDFTGQKKIDKKYIEEWITNPVVKKSVRETINLINAILEKYGTPKEIVIEMCKESSSKEERQNKRKLQIAQEKENKSIKEILGSLELEKRFFPYIKFWKEQEGKCLLTGEIIPLEDLINNISKYEIAHIIPISISFDNSNNNKMLVKRSANIKRGVQAPFEYFNKLNVERSFEDFEKQVKELKVSKNKKDLLLYKENLNRNYSDFIARNINDTRYAIKEIKNLLERFFIDNNEKVTVKGINNSFVNYVRNIWALPRLKEKSYVHYAEDSLILVIAHSLLNNLKWYKNVYNEETKEKIFYYVKTGEILTDDEFKNLFKFSYKQKIVNYTDYKFSHFIDKKPNRQLFNNTIYSLRKFKIDKKEAEYIVYNIKNIYDKDNMELEKLFETGTTEKLSLYSSDISSYKKLEKAYYDYKDLAKKEKVNPFYLYYKDNGYIYQGEKEKGTPIKNLKTRGVVLNSYYDISHKYINPKEKKVVTNRLPTYRFDVYFDGNEYKYICLRYTMISCLKSIYKVDEDTYNSELKRKNITDDYKFVCSLYNGDIVEIKTPTINGIFKFKGVNNENTNQISVDYVDKNFSAIITGLNEIKNKFNKNKNIKVSKKVNDILGENFTEEEAREYLLTSPLSSKQKIINITKLENIRKKAVSILGEQYNAQNKFKKIYKKLS